MIAACHHISKAFPEHTVLDDITFHLEKGDKAAIVGNNGAGKTTLLRIMIGEMEPDEGTVTYAKDISVGYLAQNQDISSGNTIEEELLEVRRDLVSMEARLALLEQKMQSDDASSVIEEYTELQRRFAEENGYAFRGEITGILRGLGFTDEDRSRKIGILSGGQKTRVALGKLLLLKPDLIILDEPTNHLDIGSIRWLENYLMNYRGTVLIVSHDRYFLDRTVSSVIEIENTHARVFSGNYSAYAERRKALREEEWKAFLNNQAQRKHQEEVIAKLRQFNREKSIKRAESREKMLDKMQQVNRPVTLRDDMHLVLTPCIRSGRDVLHVEDLSKSFDDRLLFSGVSFDIRRGEHVALIGDNGTGKTTILRILNQLVEPDDGYLRFGTNVHVGYYDQEHHVLNDENTVFEEISDAHPDMTNTEIRNLLASFLFTGDSVFKKIADLSGGEKGRVSLAKLMLSEANFLILDEPTNHLDLVSKEVLENALNSYEGTILYVSHDRYFINHTASRILELTSRVLISYSGNDSESVPERYLGNYDYYLSKSAEVGSNLVSLAAGQAAGTQITSSAQTAAGTSAAAGGDAWKQQKEEQARARKKAADLAKCEARISELEEAILRLDEEMALPENCMDLAKLGSLVTEKETLEQELEGLYEQWELLQS
ncbi:MAG: ABC-F family ATP-binding cassette domain-containing protein [Lachnospiraceae bacterium]|nr:ABC-F family ATP-binding cassette domain-containing protein [Lachnospiraceae bacterium]